MTSPLPAPSSPDRPAPAAQPAFRELARTFWRGITSTQGLGSALDEVLQEFNRHIGAERTSVWLHDRRDRSLSLVASSDAAVRDSAERVAASDWDAPAARGLRLDQPQLLGLTSQPGGAPVLITPLRGWRRALGTLVVEGGAPTSQGSAGSTWPATSGASSRRASRTSSSSKRCSGSGVCSRTRSTRSSTSWS